MPNYKVKKDQLEILVPTKFAVDSVVDLTEETAKPFVESGELEAVAE